MKTVISTGYLIVLAALIHGCGESDPKADKDPINDLDTAIKEIDTSEKKEPEPPEVETPPKVDPRQKLLEAEYDASPDLLINHSLEGLNTDEVEMVKNLIEASRVIEELHMLQIHPNNLEWWQQVQKQGTEIEKKVYLRNQMPWCVATGDSTPGCCALKDCPTKEMGHSFWPADMTDKEYEGFKGEINGKEILSPYTYVRRGEKGGFDAVPFVRSGLVAKRMTQVAEYLSWAAKTAPSPGLKKFLQSRSEAFLSNSAFPYDISDYDWIALKGDWDVTIGPYETYQDPRGRKAFFQMYFGKVDESLSKEIERIRENLQGMEDAISGLVGPEVYRSRKLDPRIAIRVVDVWMASGGGRSPHGVVAAFHLPNGGKSVDEGLYKKVLMVNHMEAFGKVTRQRANVVLDENQRKYVDVPTGIMETAFHELAHGFGAYSDMAITNLKGKRTTVLHALGQDEGLLEELKADVFGRWLIKFQKQKGWLTQEQERKYYVSGLMHVLGLLQYPISGVYPRMTAIQLGWYLDNGGVTWNEEDGVFAVDFEKIHGAVESLAKKVALIQLTGDSKQADELIEKYMSKNEKGEYELKGQIAKARAVMVEKFEKAGATSPTLRYGITVPKASIEEKPIVEQ